MNLNAAISLQSHGKDTPSADKSAEMHGLKITIEHPRGSERKLHDDSGKVVYRKHMYYSYGFFNGTKGRDGDEVDCMVGPNRKAKEVFVIHMKDLGPVPAEREDEDKCMIGFDSADAAKSAFLMHYPASFYGGMTCLPVDDFRERMAKATLPYRKKKITAGGAGSGRRPNYSKLAPLGDIAKGYGYKTVNQSLGTQVMHHAGGSRLYVRQSGWSHYAPKAPSGGEYDHASGPFNAEDLDTHLASMHSVKAVGKFLTVRDCLRAFNAALARGVCPQCKGKLKPTRHGGYDCVNCDRTWNKRDLNSSSIGIVGDPSVGRHLANMPKDPNSVGHNDRLAQTSRRRKESAETTGALRSGRSVRRTLRRMVESAARERCPKCGGRKISLMPTDFETAKCRDCGKTWQAKNPPMPSGRKRVKADFPNQPAALPPVG